MKGASKAGASASDVQRGHMRVTEKREPDPMGFDSGTVYVPRDRTRQTPFADEGNFVDPNAGGELPRTPWNPDER
jgi:hypothetical protein